MAAQHAGKPWWQMPMGTHATTPTAPTWGHWTHVKLNPQKGDYNGQCQRLTCVNGRAHWFNETNAKYYCTSCARAFNDVCMRNGQPPLLVLRPGPPPGEAA